MSEEAFLEAVMALRSKLYHVAISILWNEQDAADAVQEAMLKAWKRRGGLRDAARFEAWFTRILVNQCRDVQRRQIRGRKALQDAARRQEVAPGPGGELLDALRELPERLRLPVLLYYFEGYSQKEIGKILGATPEQVKGRIRQGREKLKGLLTDNDEAWDRGRREP